ncbi:ABC transporter substrate-binding protein [Ancylobacter mangrovi]|uniref:ABC transporter substrate-binding protein n=1 Tax=Ancylobacter mangrovi TaxID=2972472 RepID=UPI002161690F|nr:ABC transporter substrate-binding protein [Ancylobacter mangrovi]MCS0502162.1 ABC transporter substrate-binding protein [Ancylobacter mangrovi]
MKPDILLKAASLAVAAFIGIQALPSRAEAQEAFTSLKVGADPDYRPISFTDESGKLVGFDVDFATALGKHMGVPVDYQGMAWDGIIPALQAKKIDAITSIVVTDERKKVVDFSDPIMKQTIIGVVRADSKNTDLTAADLSKLKVGVMGNTSAATALSKIGGVEPASYNTVVDAYNDLLLGRIDVVAVESVNGSYIVATKYPDKLKVVAKPLTPDVKLNAVALRKGDAAGLAQVNKAIAEMKKDGTMEKIAMKWFGNTSVLP